MHRRRLSLVRSVRPLGVLFFATLWACAGTEAAPGPGAASVTFALRGLEGGTLPVVLSTTAGGRTIEVVDGSLRFANFAATRGRVDARSIVRVTDPGRPPEETASESAGRFERRGDTVRVTRPNGTSETYLLTDGGQRLRTLATSGCAAPPEAACMDVLRIFVLERVP